VTSLENWTIVFDWDLESIALCSSQRGRYRVGIAIEFAQGEVLNHRIESRLCFHHRETSPGVPRLDGHETSLTFREQSDTTTPRMRRLPFREVRA
jgi:hypothetical protein